MEALQSISPTHSMMRPICKEDNQAVAKIIRSVLTEFGCVGPGIAIHDPEVDAMYETYQASGAGYFVVEHDGVVVGGCGVAALKGGDISVCELQKWYVLPEVRGYGYGQMLLDKCLEMAKSYGYKQCYVETFDHMETAGRFYQRFGFSPLGGPMGSTGHFACNCWYLKEL